MKTLLLTSLMAVMLHTANASLAFYAMGDVPYNSDEMDNLEDQIDDLNGGDARFTVHLGDFNSPDDTGCSSSHFEDVADILAAGPVTTFVLAGDNDYLECPDEDEAWDQYKDIFVGFEDEWNHSLDVDRKSGGSSSRPGGKDLFAFYEEGILFVSTALMNGDGWSSRASASFDWIEEQLGAYKDEDDFRGVVIFSHAEDSDEVEEFLEDIEDLFDTEGVDVPVLYLCGDKHTYTRKTEFNDWDQLDYVSVDQGGCADPILVEVADDGDSFSGSNVFGNGLFKINRRGGRYRTSECR